MCSRSQAKGLLFSVLVQEVLREGAEHVQEARLRHLLHQPPHVLRVVAELVEEGLRQKHLGGVGQGLHLVLHSQHVELEAVLRGDVGLGLLLQVGVVQLQLAVHLQRQRDELRRDVLAALALESAPVERLEELAVRRVVEGVLLLRRELVRGALPVLRLLRPVHQHHLVQRHAGAAREDDLHVAVRGARLGKSVQVLRQRPLLDQRVEGNLTQVSLRAHDERQLAVHLARDVLEPVVLDQLVVALRQHAQEDQLQGGVIVVRQHVEHRRVRNHVQHVLARDQRLHELEALLRQRHEAVLGGQLVHLDEGLGVEPALRHLLAVHVAQEEVKDELCDALRERHRVRVRRPLEVLRAPHGHDALVRPDHLAAGQLEGHVRELLLGPLQARVHLGLVGEGAGGLGKLSEDVRAVDTRVDHLEQDLDADARDDLTRVHLELLDEADVRVHQTVHLDEVVQTPGGAGLLEVAVEVLALRLLRVTVHDADLEVSVRALRVGVHALQVDRQVHHAVLLVRALLKVHPPRHLGDLELVRVLRVHRVEFPHLQQGAAVPPQGALGLQLLDQRHAQALRRVHLLAPAPRRRAVAAVRGKRCARFHGHPAWKTHLSQ
eukprot:Rhum_TRINITY_DN12474_c1_g1::Rhum_TRINITY_DN12474_c1_g1_i1::g.52230::m.52230